MVWKEEAKRILDFLEEDFLQEFVDSTQLKWLLSRSRITSIHVVRCTIEIAMTFHRSTRYDSLMLHNGRIEDC